MEEIIHNPVLIVIAGPNGSGKTSVTFKILHCVSMKYNSLSMP